MNQTTQGTIEKEKYILKWREEREALELIQGLQTPVSNGQVRNINK